MTADERNHIRAAVSRARQAQLAAGTHGYAATAYDAANGDGWEALNAAITVRRLITQHRCPWCGTKTRARVCSDHRDVEAAYRQGLTA